MGAAITAPVYARKRSGANQTTCIRASVKKALQPEKLQTPIPSAASGLCPDGTSDISERSFRREVWEIRAWSGDEMAEKSIACPKCGCTKIDYVEEVAAHFQVTVKDGKYIVGQNPDWHANADFNRGEGRFLCDNCLHEWPVPEDFYDPPEES